MRTLFLIIGILASMMSCKNDNSSATNTGTTTKTDSKVEAPSDTKQSEAHPVAALAFRNVPINEIPASMKMKGKIESARTFSDKSGENWLLTSSSQAKTQTTESKYLMARLFRKTGDTYTQVWEINDNVEKCEFDLSAAFLKDGFALSDNDHDGETEVSVAYKLACVSDVSPAEMKVIIREGTNKYALRGLMQFNIPTSSMMPDDGKYQSTKDFTNSPEILVQAKKIWDACKVQKNYD